MFLCLYVCVRRRRHTDRKSESAPHAASPEPPLSLSSLLGSALLSSLITADDFRGSQFDGAGSRGGAAFCSIPPGRSPAPSRGGVRLRARNKVGKTWIRLRLPVWSSYQRTIAPSSIQHIIPLSFLRAHPLPPSFVSFPLASLSHFLFASPSRALSSYSLFAEALTRPLMWRQST